MSAKNEPISGGVASIRLAQAGARAKLVGMEGNVCLVLVSHANAFSGAVEGLGIATIAREAGCSLRTAYRTLAALATKRIITVESGGGRRVTNCYKLTLADEFTAMETVTSRRQVAMETVTSVSGFPAETVTSVSGFPGPETVTAVSGFPGETVTYGVKNGDTALADKHLRNTKRKPPLPPKGGKIGGGKIGAGEPDRAATLGRQAFNGEFLAATTARKITDAWPDGIIRLVVADAERNRWGPGLFARQFDDPDAMAGYAAGPRRPAAPAESGDRAADRRRSEDTQGRDNAAKWRAMDAWGRPRLAELPEPERAALLAEVRAGLGSLAHLATDAAGAVRWGNMTRGPLIAALEKRGHVCPTDKQSATIGAGEPLEAMRPA